MNASSSNMTSRWIRMTNRLAAFPQSLLLLLARVGLAVTFWRSGLTKVDEDFMITDLTVQLFADEYGLPLLTPEYAAYLATFFELAMPPLLLLGIATRFAAAPLLGMSIVIQCFVYPNAYPTHALWAVAALLLMTRGAGAISFDYCIRRHFATAHGFGLDAVRPHR
jgi:putative oxidoreductase